MNSEIQKNRRSEVTLEVFDSNQTPLVNQEVTIEQTKHKFLSGTAAFDLIPLANGHYEGEALEQAQARADKLAALFNAATLPFYWARFEPERGQPMTDETKCAAQWCTDHGL